MTLSSGLGTAGFFCPAGGAGHLTPRGSVRAAKGAVARSPAPIASASSSCASGCRMTEMVEEGGVSEVPRKGEGRRWLRLSRPVRARAREEQADKLFREIIEIADDASGDYVTTSDGKRIVDHENIQRSRLRVDARKWAAAKLAPKKYGDGVEHDVKGGLNFQPAVLVQIGGGAPEPVEVSGKVIEAE
jgi:hypothetical protein